jgi:hypothetical protein
MACCLQWRHLCPTAPDTLTCYPFGADDPFVLQQCPHIMFAGNQPEFDTRLMEGEPGCCTKMPSAGIRCQHLTCRVLYRIAQSWVDRAAVQ